MKDKAFNLIIVGIVGIVLLVGALLILQDIKSTGKAIASAPKVSQERPAPIPAPKPEAGELCEIKADCKLLSSCSSVTDGLVSDGVDMGCVDAKSTSNIPYCAHMTKARGGAACDPADKNARCVCL